MNNINDLGKFYAENIGLVHNVARKSHRRLLAIGASIDYEDIVQDLSLVFIKSFEKFEPEKGKFSTYFYYAAFNKLNRIASDFEMERVTLSIKSVEEISENKAGYDEPNDGAANNLLVSHYATPEQTYEVKQIINDVTKKLTPLAKLIVDWLIDTPKEVESELIARRAHTQIAIDAGSNCRCKHEVDLGFVCEMLIMSGCAAETVKKARRELEKSVRSKCNE